MRLTDKEVEIIKSSIKRLDENAKIYLFGSRVIDTKKGGDIDLLVMSGKLVYDDRRKILSNIFKELDEQKIDIIITKDTQDSQPPFIRIALKQGVLL